MLKVLRSISSSIPRPLRNKDIHEQIKPVEEKSRMRGVICVSSARQIIGNGDGFVGIHRRRARFIVLVELAVDVEGESLVFKKGARTLVIALHKEVVVDVGIELSGASRRRRHFWPG